MLLPNRELGWLLQSRACPAPRASGAGLVTAEQRLPSTQGFAAPRAALPAGWRCTRCWEGTQQGHLTPIDQRDLLHHTTQGSAIKLGEWRLAGAALAQGLAGHRSVRGKQLLAFASLVSLGL